MSSHYETTERFFRPNDVAALRRNQRRIQIQRAILIASRVVPVVAVLAGAIWMVRHTQSDARFALKTIEISGAVHTPQAAIEAVTHAYVGANLFRLDISRVQNDLRSLGWVSRIEAEKKLPGTLRVRVFERAPVALVQSGGALQYVDENGAAFAELSPAVGDADLPLIVTSAGAPAAGGRVAGSAAEGGRAHTGELSRCVAFLRDLRARDPQLYARVSEVRPLPPDGFAIFDRQLGAVVYANASDVSAKWRELYAIAQAEKLPRAAIAYADLRFADRIVIKPVRAEEPRPETLQGVMHAED